MTTSGVEGRALVHGSARGPVCVLDEPLSFWGGMDPSTGRVVDRRHPQSGVCLTGTILVLPLGRGSSSSSTVLAESLRSGSGPAGIVLAEPDQIIAVGSFVARELYEVVCPVVVVNEEGYRMIARWNEAEILPSGGVEAR